MENAPQLPSNYQLIGKLGIGSFATVWEAHDTENNTNVAIKIIPHDLENPDSNWRERLDNEVNVLSSIHHPHIAEFYKEIEEKDVSYLVFELCEKGTLGHLMLKLGQIPEDQMRGYFLQISEALRYLHEEAHIIHRDIKIDNILFDSDNTIKLIDFGLSVHFNPEENERFTKICGSPKYVAPEMFFGEEYDSSIDIWALGVVLFYCISGYFPFESYQLQKLSYKIMFEEPIYPLGISDELLDLIKKLLDKEPDDRITWTQIFDHPWVKKAVPVTKESSKRSIMRPHPSNKLAPSVVPKIEPHETLNILEHEEYHDTITITHHIQATIKYPFTSSLSHISNITPATPPGQRRKRALNDSYDKITTVFQVRNSHLCESQIIS